MKVLDSDSSPFTWCCLYLDSLQNSFIQVCGVGGGATQQSFVRGGSAPRSKPLPFYIPFSREKVPLLIQPLGRLFEIF